MEQLEIDLAADDGVRTVTVNGVRRYVLRDVARRLGYTKAADIRGIAGDRRLLPVFTTGGPQLMATVSANGLASVLARTRSPEAATLGRELGVPVRWVRYAETETIGVISAALKHWPQKKQYQVEGYRLDLYFTKKKIAVECDENGHRDRDPHYEETRQRKVEEALGCMFVRYDPYRNGFNVGEVINEILRKGGS